MAGSLDEYDLTTVAQNYNLSQYARDTEALGRETLQMTRHGQNAIEGSITLTKKKLLFFSIPFDKGWRALVDGKEDKIERVNIGFMGLMLDKGEHTIELTYRPPFILTGTAISAAGILIFLFLAVFTGKNRRSAAVL